MPRTRLALALVFLAFGCADLTAPSGSGPSQETAVQANPVGTVATPELARPARAAEPGAPARVHASHILIAYQGAMRSQATRSKDEAKKLAEQVLGRARAGQDFAKLARDISDDPTAKARGGDLGTFDRNQMTKAFSDAAFALKVGEISNVVETEFGFHIIKRTE